MDAATRSSDHVGQHVARFWVNTYDGSKPSHTLSHTANLFSGPMPVILLKRRLSQRHPLDLRRNYHEPSTPLPPGISAHPRVFENTTLGLPMIQYTQYRGTRSPPIGFGQPGDMFIDVSPGAYRVFVRYRSWREWPGIDRDDAMRFVHPEDKTRVVWCTRLDVIWYKKNSVRRGTLRLFGSSNRTTFLSANELIRRSAIAKEGLQETELRPQPVEHPIERRSKRLRSRFNAPTAMDNLDLDTSVVAGQTDGGDVGGAASSSPPDSLFDISSEEAVADQPVHHHDTSSPQGPTAQSPPRDPPITLDDAPNQPNGAVLPHFVLTSQINDTSHEANHTDLYAVKRHFVTSKGSQEVTVCWTQYRGYGDPPEGLGEPGDMFIDMSPNAYRLFARYDIWQQWSGVSRVPVPNLFHPADGTRMVWCTATDILWYRFVSFSKARCRILRRTKAAFVTAHELIKKSGVLTRSPVGELFRVEREGEAPVPLTDVHSASPVLVAETEMGDGSNDEHPGEGLAEDTLTQAPDHPRCSPAPGNQTISVEQQSDHEGVTFDPECSQEPGHSPSLEMGHSAPQFPLDSGSNLTRMETWDAEAIRDEAERIRKFRESCMARETRYTRRREELAEKATGLSVQENAMELQERHMVERLADVKAKASQRKEQIEKLADELDREEREVITMEENISQREEALERRRESVAKIQQAIQQWDRV
ncbi:hypothetical protein Hypma_001964 [Hypsizygus marmoreus]|uniref:Uncharacterized protein n=1 Tax=Hypsizygus marmoreus TaxID=39966 RepID=A0A369JCI1_HYPMA|nr:hypothetical protein Hypma_001964 [Hypsizygus marmoreus]